MKAVTYTYVTYIHAMNHGITESKKRWDITRLYLNKRRVSRLNADETRHTVTRARGETLRGITNYFLDRRFVFLNEKNVQTGKGGKIDFDHHFAFLTNFLKI